MKTFISAVACIYVALCIIYTTSNLTTFIINHHISIEVHDA